VSQLSLAVEHVPPGALQQCGVGLLDHDTPGQHSIELAAGAPARSQQVVPVHAVSQHSLAVEHVPPGALQQCGVGLLDHATPGQHSVEIAAGAPARSQQVVPVHAVVQHSLAVEHVPPGALQQCGVGLVDHDTPGQHSVEIAAGAPAGSQQVLSVHAVVQQSAGSEHAAPGEPHETPPITRTGIINKAMIATADAAAARHGPESITARRLSERWREVN